MIAIGEVQSLLGRFAIFATPFAVAAIAYAVASILREPEDSKLTWTLIAFVLALVAVLTFVLVGWLRRRASAGKLEDGLAAGSGRGDRQGEVDALRKSWKDSVAKLRSTTVAGGGSSALSAFPWYVIIGAPASGKSTLLRQSGLDFPVGDAAIRGLQGTRNCDWWFSNVGVFLDTAGRYISDESAEEWAQFLDLVRKGRTGAPINGVVVALPATDLLQRSAEELDLEARRIRARLDELIDHLGVNFPVWIVVTKVDLIGGFVEFFGQADAATRQQMMGWTVGEEEGARFDLPNFERRFAAAIHRLREIRPAMLEIARLRDRPAAFGFPDELAAAGDPLGRMLQRIFEPNVYQETPLYRGVYVTSATQQGTPLQRAAEKIRELLGAPAADPEPQGAVIRNAYFVKDLMHERIVRDREMTWTTPKEIERGKLRRVGINLIGCAVGVFLLLLVLASGLKASAELEVVEANVGKQRTTRGGEAGKCDLLWQAASHASDSNYRNLGLSQQRNLKEDLLQRQREIYRDGVLLPAVRQWREDIAAAPVEKGIAAAAESYRQFLAFEAALVRADHRDDPAAETPKKEEAPPRSGGDDGDGEEEDEEEPDGTKPKDPKAPEPPPAPADPGRAPKGFFSADARTAVEGRLERLRTAGIVGNRKADRSPDLLLDLVWRNKGGATDAAIERQALHDAFRTKVAEWMGKAGDAVASIEQDASAERRYFTGARDGFVEACGGVYRQFETRNLQPKDLDDALDKLAEAAAGGGGAAGGTGADAERTALLDSIGPGFGAVADAKKPLLPEAAIRAMRGYDVVARWAGRGASAESAGADAATKSALGALAAKLRELKERSRSGELIPRPWPADNAADVRIALDQIEVHLVDREKAWAAEVVPHLAALSGSKDAAAYLADSARPLRAVELIEPALRRNAAFVRFLEGDRPGTWKRFARRVVDEHTTDFTRATLSSDLDKLLAAAVWGRDADVRRFVCPSLVAGATKLAREQFDLLVAAAIENWDSRFRSLPRYSGSDHWGYLERWAATEGQVSKVARDLKTAFGDWSLDASLRAAAIAPLAREVWPATDALKARYEFFTAEYEEARTALSALTTRSGWNPPADLAKVGADLGPTGKPVWRSGAVDRIPADTVGDALRNDLRRAVDGAEDELVARIEKHFDGKWGAVRRKLIGALAPDATAETAEAAGAEFDEFLGNLKLVFGDDLSLQPGNRLAARGEFRTTATVVADVTSLRKRVARPMTMQLSCRKIPTPKREGDAVALPHLEIQYEEKGARPQTKLWTPGKPDPWTLTWFAGRGSVLRLVLWDEKHEKSKLFREWPGEDCVVDAIRDGAGPREATWTGPREFDAGVFEFVASDPEALRRLVDRSAPDPNKAFATDCVEVLERR